MKKLYFSLAVILGMFAALSSVLCGQDQTPIQIIVSQQEHGGQVPRMPEQYPISGFVISDTICLLFSDNLGDVSVSLSEANEGQLLSTIVDSSEGFAFIPFDGSAGLYTLTFSLNSGVTYIGRFELL